MTQRLIIDWGGCCPRASCTAQQTDEMEPSSRAGLSSRGLASPIVIPASTTSTSLVGPFIAIVIYSCGIHMLKLILKLIFAFAATFLLVFQLFSEPQGDPKIVAATVAAFGFMVLAGVDIFEFRKSKIEKHASLAANRKRDLRAILDNFKINFADVLVKLEIIENKYELTYERLHELSQDTRVLSVLSDKAVGIRNSLEEFSELYEADR